MELNLISFNLRCQDDPDGHSIAERAPRLEKILDPLDADVLCFQEIRPLWEEHLWRIFDKKYLIDLRYRSKERPEGNAILWKKDRFRLEKSGQFWLSDTPHEESLGWDEKYYCPRICTYANFVEQGSGVSFSVMNTHFGFGDACQTKSAALIKDFSLTCCFEKCLIAGDFNMTPETCGYQAMALHFTDANEMTARDRRSTYHGYDLSVERKMHIDYIFTTEKVIPKSFSILDSTVNGKFPSDHFGIQATLLV